MARGKSGKVAKENGKRKETEGKTRNKGENEEITKNRISFIFSPNIIKNQYFS